MGGSGRLRGLGVVALVLSACVGSNPIGEECDTGEDCESGACNDGVCVDLEGGSDADGGSGGSGASQADGGNGASGGSGAGDEGGGSAGGPPGLCMPDADGIVARDEMPLAAGLEAQFRVASNVTASSAGEMVDGVLTWDFGGSFTGDHDMLLETRPLAGTWYENSFPGATYASLLSDGDDLLGVFEITEEALLLRGVVSPEDGLYKTELEYDPPVVILQFPLSEGATWTTDTTVSGTAQGVFSLYYEAYESEVDARGEAITPFSTFDVLRVGVRLTRNVGGFITVQKTFAFVTECFGTVATMASQSNELDEEFTDVAELKRLTP